VQGLLLFATAFGAATILPLASAVPLALIVHDSGQVLWPVVVATCGNYLGACTTYALARLAVRRFVPREDATWRRASGAIARFGAPAMLLSWLPVLGDVLVAVAGGARMPFVRFSIWTAIGKGARYAVVAWAASQIGTSTAVLPVLP
jgi:membrane protein YqaA with SNARE-associated domain